MKKYFIILLSLLILGGGAWFLFGKSGSKQIKVLKTGAVKLGKVRQVLEATGIVKAQVGAMIKIGARATGTLASVPVKVGDRVTKGTVLAEIDDRELKAKLAEAKARLRLAQAKLDYASKTLPRKRTLVKKKLEPQDALDKAVQDERVARFEVDAATATVHTLEVQLSYTRIVSPISGVVSQIAAQEGETVVAGLQVANLVTVLDPSLLEMWIYIDETDVGRIREGLPVEFTVDAYPGTVFRGQVDRVYHEPEVRDNIVYYKALVRVGPQEAAKLRPEMTTQCKVVVTTKKNVLSVPNAALKWVKGKQVVFKVVPGSQPEEVIPELGLQGLKRSEVLKGLKAGDKVATKLVLPGKKKK